MMQLKFLFTTVDGITFDYDAVSIITLVEEDGKLRMLEVKDFADPEKRSLFYAGAAKLMGKGSFAA
jgi:hypothetical protein